MQTKLGRTVIAYEHLDKIGWSYRINYDEGANEVLLAVVDATDTPIMEPIEIQEIAGWLAEVLQEINTNQIRKQAEEKEGA